MNTTLISASELAARIDDPAVVIAKIERLCDAAPGSFRNDAGAMTADDMAAVSGPHFICALYVATAVGLKFGFTGNAAEATPEPR